MTRPGILSTLVILSVIFIILVQGAVENFEGDLITELLDGYVPAARPILTGEDSVDVKLTIVPYAMFLTWSDYRLRWNSSEHRNLELITLNHEDVWTPVIAVQSQIKSRVEEINVAVYYDGTIEHYQIWDIDVGCDIDIDRYPFDKQTCAAIFVPSGYFNGEINLQPGALVMSTFQEDPVWNLTNVSLSSSMLQYSEDSSINRVLLRFEVTRRKIYNWVVTILPILILDTLGSLGFLIPIESGEKIGFTVAIQLTLFVFFLVVIEKIPPSSTSVAFLNIIVIVVILKMMLNLLATIVSMNMHYRPKINPPPSWLRKLLCMKENKVSTTNINNSEHWDKVDGLQSTSGDDLQLQWTYVRHSLQKVFCGISVFATLVLAANLVYRSTETS